LLEHLPPRLHLVLAGRQEPPLPLARLRARRQVAEIHAADLRFGDEETAAFFRLRLGSDLDPGDLLALAARTEGWAAGLQLAALSLRDQADRSGFIRRLGGDDRYIVDYLGAEVFQGQPPAVQAFLLDTAPLARLSGPLCDAVTGRTDSAAMLAALEQANLFLLPLDNTRDWYRYHALFAEMLLARLRAVAPARQAEIHTRASAWHEQQGQIREAVEHALAAPDWPRVLRLIGPISDELASRGEQATLHRWLSALPDAVLATDPDLCVWYGWVLFLNQSRRSAERPMAVAEAAWRASGDRVKLAGLLNLRIIQVGQAGDVAQAEALARESESYLPPDCFGERLVARLHLMLVYNSMGHLVAMRRTLAEAQQIAHDLRAVPEATLDYDPKPILAEIDMLAGSLAEAEGRLGEAIALQEYLVATGDEHPRVKVFAQDLLARALYQRNDLAAAEEQARQGLAGARQLGQVTSIASAIMQLGRIAAARGATAEALANLAEAERHMLQYERVEIAHAIAAYRAWVWLLHGSPAEARRWAAACDLALDVSPPFYRLTEWMILARVRLADGHADGLGPVLRRLLDDAVAAGRRRDELLLSLLLALILAAQGAFDQALPVLERALALAAPAGYVRPFLDEGPAMAALLDRAAAQTGYLPFVRRVRALFPAGPPVVPIHPAAGPTLSAREQAVLRLVAQGASNDDIAAALTISVHTAKKHVGHIYRKLGVATRTQAVAAGQQRGWL
jgi:LuxR family maltose regulon positive regulatory protein